MKTREVIFDTSTTLTLLDAYENPKASIEVSKDTPMLIPVPFKREVYGAKHINARHSNPKDIGYITQQELLNIGNHMREYLKEHKEPFIDKNGARIYEWKNKQGVRFRVVVGNKIKPNRSSTTSVESEDLPLLDDRIITFYSDRNFKQKMKFRNPNLRDRSIIIW